MVNKFLCEEQKEWFFMRSYTCTVAICGGI